MNPRAIFPALRLPSWMLALGCITLLLMVGCGEPEPLGPCEDPLCAQYYDIWERQFLLRSHMDQAFFEEHVDVGGYLLHDFGDYETFTVHYVVTVDWAEAQMSDWFLVWLDSALVDTSDPGLPREAYFSENEVVLSVNARFWDSRISRLVEHGPLRFGGKAAALQALRQGEDVSSGTVEFAITNRVHSFPDNGHMWLWRYTSDEYGHGCKVGAVDLHTGETIHWFPWCP